jgi:hypothetical protein
MGSPRGFQSRFAVLADGDTTITCWVAGTFRWTGASCEAQASVLAHPPSWLHSPRSLLRWLRCGDVVPSSLVRLSLSSSRAFARAVPRPSRRGPTARGFARVVSHVGSSQSVSGTFRPLSLDPRRLGMARPPPRFSARSRGLLGARRRSFEPSEARCSCGTLFTCDVRATRSWVAH